MTGNGRILPNTAGDRRLQRFAPAGAEQLQMDGATKAGADAACMCDREDATSSSDDDPLDGLTSGGNDEHRVMSPV